MSIKKSKKTSSVANTLKVLKISLIRTHRGISSCRVDDVRTLPRGNVLLPFDVIIIAYSPKIVKDLTIDFFDL